MKSLSTCPSCGGFARAEDASCPHCQQPVPQARPGSRALLLGLMALCGGTLSVTLMACYGLPPCDHGNCYPDLRGEDLSRPDLAPADAGRPCPDGGTTDGGGCTSPDLR